MYKNEIARKLFYSLQRDTFYKQWYIVLRDQNLVAIFRAESDAEAIEIFNNGGYKK
jgi:hypothetical protein